MRSLDETPTNAEKTARLERTLRAILADALQRGFYGTVGVELAIQDGTIQQIRQKIERVER